MIHEDLKDLRKDLEKNTAAIHEMSRKMSMPFYDFTPEEIKTIWLGKDE